MWFFPIISWAAGVPSFPLAFSLPTPPNQPLPRALLSWLHPGQGSASPRAASAPLTQLTASSTDMSFSWLPEATRSFLHHPRCCFYRLPLLPPRPLRVFSCWDGLGVSPHSSSLLSLPGDLIPFSGFRHHPNATNFLKSISRLVKPPSQPPPGLNIQLLT